MSAALQQPLALTFNLDITSPKGAAIQTLLDTQGIAVRAISLDELGQTVGYLAELPGFSATRKPYTGPLPQDEFLLLCFMDDTAVMDVVRAMRAAGCPVGCKATLTEHNRSWSFGQLVQEVSEEHAAMMRYRAAQQ